MRDGFLRGPYPLDFQLVEICSHPREEASVSKVLAGRRKKKLCCTLEMVLSTNLMIGVLEGSMLCLLGRYTDLSHPCRGQRYSILCDISACCHMPMNLDVSSLLFWGLLGAACHCLKSPLRNICSHCFGI